MYARRSHRPPELRVGMATWKPSTFNYDSCAWYCNAQCTAYPQWGCWGNITNNTGHASPYPLPHYDPWPRPRPPACVLGAQTRCDRVHQQGSNQALNAPNGGLSPTSILASDCTANTPNSKDSDGAASSFSRSRTYRC